MSMACPNLTGSYLCETEDDYGNTTKTVSHVTQKVVDGNTLYTITDEYGEVQEMHANAKPVKTDDGYITTTSCEGEKLKINLIGNENGIDVYIDLENYLAGELLMTNMYVKATKDGEILMEDTISSSCDKL